MNTERFHNIEDIIGYTFHDLELLVTALTHKPMQMSGRSIK
ncbi:hypothetical protein [Clostridium sp. AM46-21]